MSDVKCRKASGCVVFAVALALGAAAATGAVGEAAPPAARGSEIPASLLPAFRPPPEFAGDLGTFRSPLKFDDGRPVRNVREWRSRRAELLRYWHGVMGEWPPLVENGRLEVTGAQRREGFTQREVRFAPAPGRESRGYVLVPDGNGPFPAVLVVYYEPETAIGKGGSELRDFAYQLVKRGFVTLSIGSPYDSNYPRPDGTVLQPLSFLAYVASNAREALAREAAVDPNRIGIVGHSYGAKWAMFASCLDEKFACAAWSDGGIVFDESRPNVNYWEPWYLGFDRAVTRKRGVITRESPRTGAYKKMIEEGRDLHELHALMAPRPFLVSGGSEDPPERWRALNHTVAVNRLLRYENRVAMTNRPTHSPTAESNERMYEFLKFALR